MLLSLLDLVIILFLVFFYPISFRLGGADSFVIGLLSICRARHVRMVMGRVLLE